MLDCFEIDDLLSDMKLWVVADPTGKVFGRGRTPVEAWSNAAHGIHKALQQIVGVARRVGWETAHVQRVERVAEPQP